MQSPVINELIDAFKQLPTIGQKSAQRLAYYLLQDHQATGHRLVNAIDNALAKVGLVKVVETFLNPMCVQFVLRPNVLGNNSVLSNLRLTCLP